MVKHNTCCTMVASDRPRGSSTSSEGLKSFPAFDHAEVGGGLPRILIAETVMVSPAFTVKPSFKVGSITMLGASVKQTENPKCYNKKTGKKNIY